MPIFSSSYEQVAFLLLPKECRRFFMRVRAFLLQQCHVCLPSLEEAYSLQSE